MSRTRRPARSLLPVMALTTLLVACGGEEESDEDWAETRSETNEELADQVPEHIAEDGQLTIGVDPEVAPLVYRDEGSDELTGFEAEFAREIAAVLGLEPQFETTSFTSLISGLDAQRYETVMSFVVDTKERQETVDFVNYILVGAGVMVEQGNPLGIEDPEDLCGVATVVGANSQGERAAGAISADCEEAGEAPVDILVVQSPTEVPQAITTGRADAAVNVSLQISHTMDQVPDTFEVAGEFFDEAPGGAMFHKEDEELRDVFAQAVQHLQDEGIYQELLEEFGLDFAALEGAPINSAEE